MILLNTPWSYYDHNLATARRRRSLLHAICLILYCAGAAIIGYALGALVYGTP